MRASNDSETDHTEAEPRLRVLAADDELSILSLYESVLSPTGGAAGAAPEDIEIELSDGVVRRPRPRSYEVVLCQSGPDAVEAVRRAVAEDRPFPVAFLDVRMPPGPDGIWAAERIRELDPEIAIVFVTAFSDIDPEEISRRVPPADKLLYLRKPAHPAEIRQFAWAMTSKWQSEHALDMVNLELENVIMQRTEEMARVNRELRREMGEPEPVEDSRQDAPAAAPAKVLSADEQSLDSVARVAGRIAHDFNNILTVVRGYSELMQDMVEDQKELAELVAEIQKAGDRGAAFTQQLLAFSQRRAPQPGIVSLNEIVEGLEPQIGARVGDKAELTVELTGEPTNVLVDPVQIEHVIMNLADNARDATLMGGRVSLETGIAVLEHELATGGQTLGRGTYVTLSVCDTGAGIDARGLARIFEPFYSTKEKSKGAGLGLAIVYGIVRQSAGGVVVESVVGEGAAFTVYLPRAEGDGLIAPVAAPTPEPAALARVLLVENEDNIRSLVAKILVRAGYAVVDAAGGEEALALLDQGGDPIDLLLTDIVMPEMDGRELARQADRRVPGIKVLFMSGYSEERLRDEHNPGDHFEFIHKPFTTQGLAAKVQDVLDGD